VATAALNKNTVSGHATVDDDDVWSTRSRVGKAGRTRDCNKLYANGAVDNTAKVTP